MPSTYTLISSNVLTSSAASVTFSAIPSTYTDLVLRVSARTDDTTDVKTTMTVTLNNDTSSNYSSTSLRTNNGTTISSGRDSNVTYLNQYFANAANSTSNTFSSLELYLPSYTSSANKPIGVFFTREGNTTAVDLYANANLWRNTASVNSIQIGTFGLNFVSGSSFYLYGISKS
jgi:hypothetical protein